MNDDLLLLVLFELACFYTLFVITSKGFKSIKIKDYVDIAIHSVFFMPVAYMAINAADLIFRHYT